MIAEAGLRAEVWGFSRAVQADVEALVELGVQASVIESPISDGKLDALGVSRETMLERIRTAVRVRDGERHPRRVLRRRLLARRPRASSTRRTRRRSRRAPRRSSSSTRSGSRPPRRPRCSSRAASTGSGRRAGALARPRRLRARARPRRSPPSRRARPGCRGRSTGWASGPATPTSSRSRWRSRRCTGSRPGSTCTQARDARRTSSPRRAGTPLPPWKAGHRRRPLHARVGRRRRAVPRPAGDRAVLVRARRRRARHRARQEERDRLDPDRRPSGSGSTSRRSVRRSCSSR